MIFYEPQYCLEPSKIPADLPPSSCLPEQVIVLEYKEEMLQGDYLCSHTTLYLHWLHNASSYTKQETDSKILSCPMKKVIMIKIEENV